MCLTQGRCRADRTGRNALEQAHPDKGRLHGPEPPLRGAWESRISPNVSPLSKPNTPLGTLRKVGVPIIAALLGLATLVIMAVLVKGFLDKHYFFCGEPLHFIPRGQLCDGRKDCASGEDELLCVKSFPDGPPVAVRLSRDRSTLQVLDPATRNWASACFDNFTEAMARTACAQMGYDSKPTFSAVEIGPDQDLGVVEITENSQELQVLNSSG
ncbi:hypothetical protein MC885_003800 [Smutsia gigantea]|nr:hypothetical protein MC885_003800 [Smutsia gigantea]